MEYLNATSSLLSLYNYLASAPFVLIATLLKAFLFSAFLINIFSALLVAIHMGSVISLLNNKVSIVMGTLFCLYTEVWNYGSGYMLFLAYFSALYLGCYSCEGCWYVALKFKLI